jgi:Zn-dependent protease
MEDSNGEKAHHQHRFSLSINFQLILVTTIILGIFCYYNVFSSGLIVFLYVAGGWIISLCLHEFGHALAAYYGGDYSVVDKGYFTLDPLKYTHPVFSLVAPMVFLLLGGIGLPGGAVYINLKAIPDNKKRSLVSAAGPLATLGVALLLIVPFWILDFSVSINGHYNFWAAVSFLAFLQITALILNLLPIPGLDGFRIIEPFISEPVMKKIHEKGGLIILILMFLLFYDSPVNRGFWYLVGTIATNAGLDINLIFSGYELFKFWN